MVIMMVSSSRENAMLSAVRALRRLLRKAFLATKWASVITHANRVARGTSRFEPMILPALVRRQHCTAGYGPADVPFGSQGYAPQRQLKKPETPVVSQIRRNRSYKVFTTR